MKAISPRNPGAAPLPTVIAAASLPAYCWLAAMLAATAALVGALGFVVDRHDLPLMAGLELFLLAAAMLMRLRGWGRAATAIEAVVLIVAATMAAACLNALLATTGLSYRDTLLDRIDHDLLPMVTWQEMFGLLRRSGALVTLMGAVYQTLHWQPLLLVTTLALVGRERRCWRFVHAWLLALVLCLVVFPFMPALGEYRLHRLLPADLPALRVDTAWRQGMVLERLRTGSLRMLSPGSMTGLISFPSFHAAGGTLLAWGFAPVRWIGKPAVALNVAMVATAPLIGAHYFVDIAAGVVVGMLAIRLSRPRS